jgi:hypothetical protein
MAVIAVAAGFARAPALAARKKARRKGRRAVVVEKTEIDKVWSGHPVGFALLTKKSRQFAAYYDAGRNMTIASRRLKQKQWKRKRLPSRVGWDSHNYIVITLDRQGLLHVSGNMHGHPLVYFRSEKPYDISSLKQHKAMAGGPEERRVTYPVFFNDAKGRLLFMFRYGSSGNGMRIVNAWHEKTGTWRRLLKTPLLDGTRQSMNAYPTGRGATKGPDGLLHIVWMWRDSPDCRTNHDVCYARSRDFVHWETAGGKAVRLPITPLNKDVVVDPTPSGKGMINIGHGVGFDHKRRPIVQYHNYDKNGKSQIYGARWEGRRWVRYQITDWDYRWDFHGGGCIEAEIVAQPIAPYDGKYLAQRMRHKKYGHGYWKLDPRTLKIVGRATSKRRMPPGLGRVRSTFKHLPMQVNWCGDPSTRDLPERYLLRWETLRSNRDRPRSGPLPDPSPLEYYHIKEVER